MNYFIYINTPRREKFSTLRSLYIGKTVPTERKNHPSQDKFLKNLLTKAISFVIIICVAGRNSRTDAAMAQLVEHILGKDEVPGSNPGSSSKTKKDERISRPFCFGNEAR